MYGLFRVPYDTKIFEVNKMKNRTLRNVIRAITIYPIALMVVPIIYMFNDCSFKESYNDVFMNFWK